MALRFLMQGLVLVVFHLLAGCGQESSGPQMPPPPEVEVSVPLVHEITEYDEYTGRFTAVDEVDLNARVTGLLKQKHFVEGDIVNVGDVLFEIDSRTYAFEVARRQAEYNLAKKEYERGVNLQKTNAISDGNLDARFQGLKVAEAALNQALLNLEFTKVRSPVHGRVGQAKVDVGSLILANTTSLARVVTVNPVQFEFEASQQDFLKYLRRDGEAMKKGRPEPQQSPANHQSLMSTLEKPPVFVRLQDETNYPHVGRLDFVDNVVDSNTGSIRLRALMVNDSGLLYPGLFGRLKLPAGQPYQALLIPEAAIITMQSQKLVYTVTPEGQAAPLPVTLGPLLPNGFVVIKEGLTETTPVIINGTAKVMMPMQPVSVVDATLTWQPYEEGVALDDVPAFSAIKARATSPSIFFEQ